jgi:FKBP-type peptidyl-prolyl cis-trans isomerase (trigger factor)
MDNTKYKITQSKEIAEKSLKEIEIEIPETVIQEFRKKAFKKISETADIPGFRKGKIPENVILEKFGETTILDESIEIFIRENMAEIIEKEANDAIAMPQISIKKAVPGNPVVISITAPLRPKMKLPDYKKLAKEAGKKEKGPIKVEEKEVEEAIIRIRKYLATVEGKKPEELNDEKNLPELTDETVKKFGDFKTFADFKEKVKSDILEDKNLKAKEKNRIGIMDKIIKETEGVIPEVLIQYEIERMKDEFKYDIERMGLKMENYLKDAKKTEADLEKEWKEPAIKRIKAEIVLREIAIAENITADKEQVEHEVNHMLQHHKDADKQRVESYVNDALRKEKVLSFLEEQ